MADLNGLLRAFRIDQQRRGLAKGTIAQRRTQLRGFGGVLDPRSLLEATRHDVEKWLDSRDLTARGRYHYLSNLHAFYTWAMRDGLTETDPTTRIVRPRLRRLVPRPIAEADLRVALAGAEPRMRAWLSLAAFQGLRCAEIAALRREDVLDGGDPPMLVVTNGKGGHQRVLPLNPEVVVALRLAGLPHAGHLFRRRNQPRQDVPVSAYTVSHQAALHLRGLNIDATMHQLRHRFGTRVYELSRDLRLTQELMGHAYPSTTSGYVAWSKGEATSVVLRVSESPAAPQHPSLFDA